MSENFRVLLVDHQKNFLDHIKKDLIEKSISIETAEDSSQAVQMLNVMSDNYYHTVVIVSKVEAEASNIIRLIAEIRTICSWLEIIIIFKSNQHSSQYKKEQTCAEGVFFCLNDSLEPFELIYHIRNAVHLGKERQRTKILETLYSGGKKLISSKDEDEAYQLLFEEVGKLIPHLDGFIISSYDEQEQIVSFPFCFCKEHQVKIKERSMALFRLR